MDRLHALTTALAALLPLAVACNAEAPKPPPSAGRVEAVAAKGPDDDAVAGFCDIHAKPGAGKAFALPPVTPAPKEAAAGARWVNVWATWCKPCVEELPMMASWGPRLSGDGAKATLQYVNVDAEAEAVDAFRAAHPTTPESLRIADAEALAPWMQELGLDPGAGLPIHAFVGADAKLRCVRAGAVTEDHYALVKALLM